MKAVLAFGIRGGHCVDNVVIPSLALAAKLAAGLVSTFGNEPRNVADYLLQRHIPRISWSNSEHFVSVTRFDRVGLCGPRSPARVKRFTKPFMKKVR